MVRLRCSGLVLSYFVMGGANHPRIVFFFSFSIFFSKKSTAQSKIRSISKTFFFLIYFHPASLSLSPPTQPHPETKKTTPPQKKHTTLNHFPLYLLHIFFFLEFFFLIYLPGVCSWEGPLRSLSLFFSLFFLFFSFLFSLPNGVWSVCCREP